VSGRAAKPADCEAQIRDADRLRDARQHAAAAKAYAAVLAMAPLRTDIRVQYANMLKDSGRPAEAEAAYRQALGEAPDDSDIHLQLGHALKLQGKRNEAVVEYRRAASLPPDNTEALKELFFAGSFDDQHQLFERRLATGGVEAFMALGEEIARLQDALRRLAEKLPDLQAEAAVPLAGYDRFRRLYDVPPAPAPLCPCRFAMILPARETALDTLYAQLAAIRAQSYPDWRLCVIGGDPESRRAVERASASDPRIAWIEATSGESIAAAERRITLSLDEDWLLFPRRGGTIAPPRVGMGAAAATRCVAGAYVTDAETVTTTDGHIRRSAPLLRQVVDFDTLLETNPFGETIAVERAAYAGLAGQLVTGSIAAARASLLLNLAGDGRVGHIPLPLVACDAKTAAAESPPGAHQAAVWAYLMAAGERRPVIVEPPDSATASLAIRWRPRDEAEPLLVIIPTRDNGGDLGNFVASLRERAERPDTLRLLVVDNGSRDPETLRILEGVAAEPGARVVPLDEPFNWSRLNNRAVELSDETLLVFANDDMLMLSAGWDRQLRGLLSRPEVGAVGARLLYPDDTVQHAGILFDWQGLAIRDGLYEQPAEAGPCGRWHVTRAVSAVDGAFLGIRREVFAAHGGFDAIGLPIAHSDIDLALKLRASGLKILWTPHVTLRHFESKSRGLDHLDPEKAARNRAERRLLAERWGIALTTEPSLNPLWHQATLPFRLLAMPSEARLWRHIRLCGSANPWLPYRGDEPAAPDQAGSSR
jgi:GT2 family glycosyltransferase/tetratricopeptide (TPR) repeat protein